MTPPHYADAAVTLWHGDCVDVLRGMPDASVDAVVTDPPYGLEFMGKEWDSFGRRQNHPLDPSMQMTKDSSLAPREPSNPWQKEASGYGAPRKNPRCRRCRRLRFSQKPCDCAAPEWDTRTDEYAQTFQVWCELWAAECLRVLKPGGHILAFGGTRTSHRLTCAIEDAGFEIRDTITWLYGSGFPKSLDVSKAIDRAAGAEREASGERGGTQCAYLDSGEDCPGHGDAGQSMSGATVHRLPTAPATVDAARWDGWGTALKPASEPVVVARKPLTGTVAATVLAYGTGALNIDACRVGARQTPDDRIRGRRPRGMGEVGERTGDPMPNGPTYADGEGGRWPANVILTHPQADDGGDACATGCVPGCPVADLDTQSGLTSSNRIEKPAGATPKERPWAGGAFNAPRPARGHDDEGGASRFFPTFRYQAKADTAQRPRAGTTAHPTVKPLDLMRWLVRLVTPPGGTVLDPFAGSGTTGEACTLEGFRAVLVEREADYLPLILDRLTRRTDPVAHLTAKARRGEPVDLGLFADLEDGTPA